MGKNFRFFLDFRIKQIVLLSLTLLYIAEINTKILSILLHKIGVIRIFYKPYKTIINFIISTSIYIILVLKIHKMTKFLLTQFLIIQSLNIIRDL